MMPLGRGGLAHPLPLGFWYEAVQTLPMLS